MTPRLGRSGGANDDARAREFELLVQPHIEEMYRVSAAIVGQEDAHDVAQQALVAAWRGWAGLRDRSRLRPWLYSILLNTCRNHLRSRRRRPRPLSLEHDPIGARIAPDPSDIGEALARRDALDRAFGTLDADHRAVLALRYTLDLPLREVAARLSVPEGTVKSRLHKAVGRLRLALEGEAADE